MKPLFNHDPKEKPIGVVTSLRVFYEDGSFKDIAISKSEFFHDISAIEGLVAASNIKEIVITIKKENTQ